MKTLLPSISAALLLSLAASAAPRLVVSTPTLVPESKIDLVLDLPATETTELGKTVDNTWLEIKPELPGKLRWKAQNIAEFIPDQSPAIGTTYTFSIPKGRKHLDATPVPPGNSPRSQSEEFRIVSTHLTNRWSSDYSPSTAGWMLVFNDETDPATAAAFISFGSKSGQRIAARLERATAAAPDICATNYQTMVRPLGKSTAVEPAPEAPCPTSSSPARSPRCRPARIGNFLFSRACRTHPPPHASRRTRNTKSETSSPSRSRNHQPCRCRRTPQDLRQLQSPACRTTFPRISSRNPSPSARARKTSPPRSTADNRPHRRPPRGGSIHRHRPPEAHLARRLPAGRRAKPKLKFEHLEPQIALPSEDVGQLAKGTRQYRLFTQNLESAHVRIKKLSGPDLIRAFQGYRHFTGNGPDNESIRPTAPLPYSLIVGTSVATRKSRSATPSTPPRSSPSIGTRSCPKTSTPASCSSKPPASHTRNAGSDDRPITQSIIQLTDIGLAWKLTPKEAFVYAFSCDTGAPLPGVKLQLFGEDAAALESATTDASGLASLPRLEAARHLHGLARR